MENFFHQTHHRHQSTNPCPMLMLHLRAEAHFNWPNFCIIVNRCQRPRSMNFSPSWHQFIMWTHHFDRTRTCTRQSTQYPMAMHLGSHFLSLIQDPCLMHHLLGWPLSTTYGFGIQRWFLSTSWPMQTSMVRSITQQRWLLMRMGGMKSVIWCLGSGHSINRWVYYLETVLSYWFMCGCPDPRRSLQRIQTHMVQCLYQWFSAAIRPPCQWGQVTQSIIRFISLLETYTTMFDEHTMMLSRFWHF